MIGFFAVPRLKEERVVMGMGVVENVYNVFYMGKMPYEDVCKKAGEFGFKAVVIQQAICLQGTLKQLEVLQSVNKPVFCILGNARLYTGPGIIGRLKVLDNPRLHGKPRFSSEMFDKK